MNNIINNIVLFANNTISNIQATNKNKDNNSEINKKNGTDIAYNIQDISSIFETYPIGKYAYETNIEEIYFNGWKEILGNIKKSLKLYVTYNDFSIYKITYKNIQKKNKKKEKKKNNTK